MLKTALIRLPTGALVVLLAALAAFAPMSIDMYLPALPEIARDLGVPAREVQATLAVFLAGFSGGMLLYGPISDRFGRRPVLLVGIAVFIVASLVCMLVERIDGLIVARLFQAVGGGAASILARTVVRDLFPPSEAASKLSLMMVLTTLAPILAPLAGAALLVASAFDMVDGAIARSTGKTSMFGGFLDSTVDRYSEIVVYIGLLVWLNTTGDDHLGSLLVLVSATGALMISYARARAEAIGLKASVGLVARPERVVLLAICLILNLPLVALWILAVATHLTAVWRMIHVWRVTQATPGERRS